jgi:hypothetical protein
MDPGVTTQNVFTARVGFPATYTDTVAQIRFYDELTRQLSALPGVQAVSLSSQVPSAVAAPISAWKAKRTSPTATTRSRRR